MRNIITIMDRIFEEIPDTFDLKYTVQIRFDKIKNSTLYTAPEAISFRWRELAEALLHFLGEPDEDWKIKIQNIFADKI